MMSCLCHPNAMQTMMTLCSYNVNTNDIMPPRFYVAQMECECWQHHGDVVCIICEPCDVRMGMCITCTCMHGARAIIKMGVFKYSYGLMGMPADSNLGKLTASHFNALITQNANENMPNMFPLVYLNENLRYCNEN